MVVFLLRLETQATSEIGEKAFCDQQLAESKVKKDALERDVLGGAAKASGRRSCGDVPATC